MNFIVVIRLCQVIVGFHTQPPKSLISKAKSKISKEVFGVDRFWRENIKSKRVISLSGSLAQC